MNQKEEKFKNIRTPQNLTDLQKKLRHQFKDIQLLHQALTHSGATQNRLLSNERLEFLGDRVLGLSLAKMLLEKFPDEIEGQISYRFHALARNETLTKVAELIDLAPNLYLTHGEEETGGRKNPGILADCCEAIIAALYMDGGIEVVEDFINEYWHPIMSESLSPPKDAKTQLQEWSQGQGLELPIYKVKETQGPPHAPNFTIEVSIQNRKPVIGKGRSKQIAEQAAAKELLSLIKDRC